jgi:hypothetical protein
MKRSNKAKGSVRSILEGILTFSSRKILGLKGSNWTSFKGFTSSKTPSKLSEARRIISAAFAFFLAFGSSSSTSSSSVYVHNCSIISSGTEGAAKEEARVGLGGFW